RNDRVIQFILLVAFLVRLSASHSSDFFVDETFTSAVTSASWESVWLGLRGDSHPPLYYLTMIPLAHLTRSVTILRLPSILMSTLSILVYYRMFCRLAQPSTARVCVAIVAV
ncbi:unnamed protein product, partial [Phaeothamnion confervicola]